MKLQSLCSALAGGLCLLAGSTVTASATTVQQPTEPADLVKLTINGSLIDTPCFLAACGGVSAVVPANFKAATIYLTEPAGERAGSTITSLNGQDVSALHISDILTITKESIPCTGECKKVDTIPSQLVLTWISDFGFSLPFFPVVGTPILVAETGALQDLSSYFNLTGNSSVFAQSDATAVPLPAALPLFGGGLALLGYLGRRRRKPMAQATA
jgi:hypothetical protein